MINQELKVKAVTSAIPSASGVRPMRPHARKTSLKHNPENSFTIRNLAETIWKMLEISVGDDIELQRDRQNPDRIMLVLHRKEALLTPRDTV